MTGESIPEPIPIVCDMSSAVDTLPERVEAYRALFTDALVGRDRTGQGIRFRFAARPGIEARVLDLAAREKACCTFFSFVVALHGDEVWWDASVIDDEAARAVLEEFFRLPDVLADQAAGVEALGLDATKTVQPIGGVESERSAP
jgi:hypothetical protein